jgi:hypothetical protein
VKLRRYTILGAIAAAVVAPAIALGIAAPAEALQPSPVGPPVLNVPSSVIGGATGNAPSSGAQLGGQIANGTKGSPAFGAGVLSKAGQVVSNYNLGTFIGGVVDQAFGIDKDGTVCAATGQDFGGTVVRTLAGASCDVYDLPPTYQPNLDGGTVNYGSNACVNSGTTQLCLTVLGRVSYQVNNSDGTKTTQYAYCSKATWGSAFSSFTTATFQIWYDSTQRWSGSVAGGQLSSAPPALQSACGTSGGVNSYKSLPSDNTNPTKWRVCPDAGCTAPSTQNVITNEQDPTRWLTCTIKTTDGQTFTANSDNFKESSGAVAPVKCPTIPSNLTAGHMTITLNGGPQVLTLYDQDSTAAYQAAQSAYPACSNGTCTLDLIDGTGSCYDGDSSRCATWVNDPNRDTKYKCKYGTYDAPIKDCFALGNAFDPAKVAAGNGIADPATGQDTKTQTTVKPDASGAPEPADAGDTREACFPTGWGAFNPLNWVLQPVKCALNWAFVPRASKMNELSGNLKSAVGGTAIAGLQAGMGNWAAFGIGDGGCNGIPLSTTIYGQQIKIDLLKACPGDALAPAANVTHLVVSAAIITAGVLACLRYIANVFGFAGFGRIGSAVHGPRFGPAPESGAGNGPGGSGGGSSEYYVVYETGREPGGIGGTSKRGIES